MFGMHIIRKTRQRAFKALSAFFLILLYLAGNVETGNFHRLLHQHQADLHSVENENDPCHRKIYHQEVVQDCGHSTHFSEYNKCKLCDVILIKDHLPSLSLFLSEVEPKAVVYNTLPGSDIILFSSSGSARAPPLG